MTPASYVRLRWIAAAFAPFLIGASPERAVRAATPPETTALIERVHLWMSRERLDLAREAAQRLMRVAPDHPDGLAALAEIELRSGEVDAARAALDRLRSARPDHPGIARVETLLRLEGPDRAKLREARLLAKAGRASEALAALRAILPDGPPDGDLALEYWELVAATPNGWVPARDGLVRLARARPDNLRYRLALAEHETSRTPINQDSLRVLVQMSRLPAFARQAQAAWRRAVLRLEAEPASIRLLRDYLAQDPDDAGVRERLEAVVAEVAERQRLEADPAYQDGRQGLAALERGDLVTAEPHLARSIAGRPEDAAVVGGMGILRLRQGRHAEARTYFERAAELTGGQAKWRDLARTATFWGLMRESGDALDAGQLVTAERAAREALQLDPDHVDALIALARVQARRGQHKEAEANFGRALRADPTSARALRGLASLYAEPMDLAGFEQLVAGLAPATRTALAAEIASLQARLLRGEADRLVAADRIDEAMRVLQRAIAADPGDPWLHYDLARLHLRRGEPAQARALLDDQLRRRPKDPASLHALALLLADTNDDEAALATLEQIAPRDRSDAVKAFARRLTVRTHTRRAEEHSRAGDREQARRLAQQAESAAIADADLMLSVASTWITIGALAEAQDLLDRTDATVPAEERPQIAGRLASLRADMLRAEAERQVAAGRIDEAVALLERAVALDERNPWLRYHLARLHAGRGDAAKGRAVLEADLERDAADAEALHALALFQSQLDEDLPALATLERIPPAKRTEGMTGLQRRIWVRVQTQRASALAQAGKHDTATQILAGAESAVAGDRDLSLSIASAWADAGEAARARRLMEAAQANEPPTAASRLRYAGLLSRIGALDELPPLFDAITGAPDLKPEQDAALSDLRDEYAVRRADSLARRGELAQALQTVRTRLETRATSRRVIFAEARILRSMGQPHDALESYRRILASHPLDDDARLALADTLIDIGDLVSARAELAPVLAHSPEHPGALESLGQIDRREGRVASAIEHFRRSLRGAWETRAASGSMGEVSRLRLPRTQSEGAEAATGGSALVADLAPTRSIASEAGYWAPYRQLADLLDRNTPWVSLGADWRFRSGTAGQSQLDAWEVPLEWQGAGPSGGRPLLRADYVRVDAGTLDLASTRDAGEFGTVLLCQPACSTGAFAQSETGVALLAGYERERLRLDIGTTPLGFPVQRVVGGARYKGDLGRFSYTVDAASRPVTSSLLSYAGARDPRTGMVWGGVQATGVRFNLSHDEGGAVGIWSLVDLHRLTGKNVLANDRFRLMSGGYWRIVNTDDRLLSVGLTGMLWRFSKNAGEFTFGHGGYYSPRHYRSVSLPVVFGERGARFSYTLRAAASQSRSRTDPAPFYPTDASLQASAEARTALTGIDPHYDGGPGGGGGYSAAAAFEYQLRPNVFAGAWIEIERSRNFEPNRVLVYFRVALDRSAARPVSLLPRPVAPTSEL